MGLAREVPSLSTLLHELIVKMEQELEKLPEVIEMRSTRTERRKITSMLTSSGGRPPYNITKEQVKQLRNKHELEDHRRISSGF